MWENGTFASYKMIPISNFLSFFDNLYKKASDLI
jgi:hypothetical protein